MPGINSRMVLIPEVVDRAVTLISVALSKSGASSKNSPT